MITALTQFETGVTGNAPTQSRNPAQAYLATLDKAQSRAGAVRSLNAITRLVFTELHPDDYTNTDYLLFPWRQLRPETAGLIRSELRSRYAPSSAVTHLSHLRGVVRQVWLLETPGFDAEMRERVLEALKTKGIKKTEDGDTAPGRHVNDGEISALVNACARDKNVAAGTRDAAIIGLMASIAGLRRTEVISLQLDNYDQANRELTVLGKGKKKRKAYLQNGAAEALADWLHLRGQDPGPLFCPVNKSGAITVTGMTSQAVYNMLKKRADQAGINDFSPHDLRRTFISNLLDAGVDVVTVSKLVGHSDPNTTKRYDRRGAEQKRQAVGKLHFPWHRRFRE